MNLLYLSWKNISYKPSSSLLSVVFFALGVGLIALLLLVNRQIEDKFEKNQAGIDLVLGAKGSPLQLILCSMYHIDNPTGNIAINEVKAFLRPGHPLLAQAVPLSLGDSYRTYRIVGTTPDFFDLYHATLAEGRQWEQVYEVVAGAAAAKALHLKMGDTFKSTHGLDNNEDLVHEDAGAFKIVGILQPTGAVADQLLLTAAPTIWAVHDHSTAAEDGDDQAEAHHPADYDLAKPLYEYTDKSITSVLIRYKANNVQTLNLPRNINENTNMQAANPAWEINRLYGIMGDSALALQVLALVIIFVSGLSVFISLYAALRDRKYELALMRVMGAPRGKLFTLILLEGLLLAGVGSILGLTGSHLGMDLLARVLQRSYRYSFSGAMWLREEWFLCIAALAIGLLAALLPAIQARKTDISATLAEG